MIGNSGMRSRVWGAIKLGRSEAWLCVIVGESLQYKICGVRSRFNVILYQMY